MAADGSYSTKARPTGEKSTGEKGHAAGEVGATSNTPQKGGALIDYLTVVFPATHLEEFGICDVRHLIGNVLGTQGEIVAGPLRNKRWQFYTQVAVLMDREGNHVGRVGMGGNGNTVCLSISGAGTRWVRNWERTATMIERLRGRLSRVDVAYDDIDGECLDVHQLRERAQQGDFAEGGRPPQHRFLSDEGHGTGSTLYVGSKGHKELCVYEKGKQLGLDDSKWVRAEVRLYGKHAALPLDVLTRPLSYLLGSYSLLQTLIRGVCTRIKTTAKAVQTTGEAWLRYLHRQVGPSLNLLRQVYGFGWAEFAENRIAREGHPGRFRGIASGDRLVELMRKELCPSAS